MGSNCPTLGAKCGILRFQKYCGIANVPVCRHYLSTLKDNMDGLTKHTLLNLLPPSKWKTWRKLHSNSYRWAHQSNCIVSFRFSNQFHLTVYCLLSERQIKSEGLRKSFSRSPRLKWASTCHGVHYSWISMVYSNFPNVTGKDSWFYHQQRELSFVSILLILWFSLISTDGFTGRCWCACLCSESEVDACMFIGLSSILNEGCGELIVKGKWTGSPFRRRIFILVHNAKYTWRKSIIIVYPLSS